MPGAAGAAAAASGARDGICGATGCCIAAGSCWTVEGGVAGRGWPWCGDCSVEGFDFKDSSSETADLA